MSLHPPPPPCWLTRAPTAYLILIHTHPSNFNDLVKIRHTYHHQQLSKILFQHLMRIKLFINLIDIFDFYNFFCISYYFSALNSDENGLFKYNYNRSKFYKDCLMQVVKSYIIMSVSVEMASFQMHF